MSYLNPAAPSLANNKYYQLVCEGCNYNTTRNTRDAIARVFVKHKCETAKKSVYHYSNRGIQRLTEQEIAYMVAKTEYDTFGFGRA